MGLVTRNRLLLALLIVLAVGLLLAGREAAALIPRFADWVQGLGTPGILAFIVAYALAAVALVPGSLLTIAGGAIFGLGYGVLFVFIGAVLGSTAAFLVARHVARDVIAARLASAGSGVARVLDAIDHAAAQRGFLIVLLLRLSPAFPFNVLNYLLGLTGVRTRDYVAASIGMLPGTFLWVYSGRIAGDVAAVAAGVEAPRPPAYWFVLALGLVATIAVTLLVTRLARRELHQRIGGASSATTRADSAIDHSIERQSNGS